MFKGRLKKLLLTGIIAITAFGVIGFGSKDDKNKEVHIGYFNNITHAQALMMKAEGTLDKSLGDDVNVKWTAFNADQVHQYLQSGEKHQACHLCVQMH